MAKKPTITTVSSGYTSGTTLNANIEALRDAFDNTVSRDGSTPNTMSADFDMNNNDILNVGTLYADDVDIAGSSVAASAAAAAASAAAAAISETNAAASFDAFDDIYLGAKASAPATDNDGDALATGALYYNTSSNEMFAWTGSAWQSINAGALLNTNDLNDLNDVPTARTNLGLGSMATQAASSVAITGGNIQGVAITNITDMAIADGGTGASTSYGALINLFVLDDADPGDYSSGLIIPSGTTGERPATPDGKEIRYNETLGQFEGYNGTSWGSIGGAGRFKGENGETGDLASGLGDIFRVHEKTLNTSVTIDADENAVAVGPLTIASGVTVTVTSGGNLRIV